MTIAPSGENAADNTSHRWPFSVSRHSPDCADQSFAVLSKDVVSTNALSGENIAKLASASWPSSVCRHLPDSALQIFAEKSSEALTASVPSGENADDRRRRWWPRSVWRSSPDSARQILALPSVEAARTSLLSGENAAEITSCRSPRKPNWLDACLSPPMAPNECRQSPVSGLQILTEPSPEAETARSAAVNTTVSWEPSLTPAAISGRPGSSSSPQCKRRGRRPTTATGSPSCGPMASQSCPWNSCNLEEGCTSRVVTTEPPRVNTGTSIGGAWSGAAR
mmetsp:Transcript_69040/g.173990  ORF Transcript_69040/g.173990 Transcript_69040/m.173990 type:complete len:280 (+) Transcript_69040:585-1424(+)